MKILITGGCGFIGTKLQERLFAENFKAVVFDNLSTQIHGSNIEYRDNFNFDFFKGDVNNIDDLLNVLSDVDIIVHLAAETGTGQSMYEMEKYIKTNCIGTANLFSAIRILGNKSKIKKIILSSSRSVYGEGAYSCISCETIIYPNARNLISLQNCVWNHSCPNCKNELISIPTPENAILNPSSIYASTKLEQEHITKISCSSLNIDYVILRFQNVYGSGQSLKNPYTGLLTVFTNQIRNNNDIHIYEDGKETRDFVHVNDVVESIFLSIIEEKYNNDIYNVGSGVNTSIEDIAKMLINLHKSDTKLVYSQKYRFGDIRHNSASLLKISSKLNFEPKINMSDGLFDFFTWSNIQEIESDNYLKTELELKNNGLMNSN